MEKQDEEECREMDKLVQEEWENYRKANKLTRIDRMLISRYHKLPHKQN